MCKPNNLQDVINNLALSIENNRVAVVTLNRRFERLLTETERLLKTHRRQVLNNTGRIEALEQAFMDLPNQP